MLRFQRGDSVQRWREAHARLANRYRVWCDDLSDKPDWSNPMWQEYRAEEAYHRPCANPTMLTQVLQDAIAAARAGPAAARRWIRAAAHAYLEHFEEALRDFDQSLALDPTNVWDLSRYANTLMLMGRYDEAVADFDQAIQLAPKYAWAIAHRGETYQAMGRYVRAYRRLPRS